MTLSKKINNRQHFRDQFPLCFSLKNAFIIESFWLSAKMTSIWAFLFLWFTEAIFPYLPVIGFCLLSLRWIKTIFVLLKYVFSGGIYTWIIWALRYLYCKVGYLISTFWSSQEFLRTVLSSGIYTALVPSCIQRIFIHFAPLIIFLNTLAIGLMCRSIITTSDCFYYLCDVSSSKYQNGNRSLKKTVVWLGEVEFAQFLFKSWHSTETLLEKPGIQ